MCDYWRKIISTWRKWLSTLTDLKINHFFFICCCFVLSVLLMVTLFIQSIIIDIIRSISKKIKRDVAVVHFPQEKISILPTFQSIFQLQTLTFLQTLRNKPKLTPHSLLHSFIVWRFTVHAISHMTQSIHN